LLIINCSFKKVLSAYAVDINQFYAGKPACTQNAQRSFLMKTKRFFLFGLPVILASGLLASGLSGCFTLFGGLLGGSSSPKAEVSPETVPIPEAVPITSTEIPFSELEQAIAQVNTAGHGFIVEAYVLHPDWMYFRIGDKIPVRGGITLGAQDFNDKYPDINKQLEDDRQYTVYIDVLKKDRYGQNSESYNGIVTRIDGLRSVAEVSAAKEAVAEAERLAAAQAKEAKQNPNGLDRSQYRKITVEDFSFDMVAGNFSAGTKVTFQAKFFTKPTGTNYRFDDVNLQITLSSNHNFVRDIPQRCFEGGQGWFGYESQRSVQIYATVRKTGQTGEATVDIIDW
jgi:hypothetical protein